MHVSLSLVLSRPQLAGREDRRRHLRLEGLWRRRGVAPLRNLAHPIEGNRAAADVAPQQRPDDGARERAPRKDPEGPNLSFGIVKTSMKTRFVYV